MPPWDLRSQEKISAFPPIGRRLHRWEMTFCPGLQLGRRQRDLSAGCWQLGLPAPVAMETAAGSMHVPSGACMEAAPTGHCATLL